MIAIIDNGKDYSSHRLYFVETESKEAIEEVLKMEVDDYCGGMEIPNPDAKLIATSNELTWLVTDEWYKRTMPFDEFKREFLDHNI